MLTLARLAKCASIIGVLLCAAGCADLRFHSATREAQAKALQKAHQDANPAAILEAERARSAAILSRELGQTENSLLVGRDAKLLALVVGGGSVNAYLVEPVNKGVNALGSRQFLADLKAAQTKERLFARSWYLVQNNMKGFGFENFTCEDYAQDKVLGTVKDWLASLKKSHPQNAMDFEGTVQEGKDICTPRGTSKKAVALEDATAVRDFVKASSNPASGSSLLVALKDLQAAEEAAAKGDAKQARVRNGYRAALLEYQRVLDSPDRNDPAPVPPAAAPAAAPASAASAPGPAASALAAQPKTKLDVALGKLKTSIGELRKLDDKLSVQLVSDERIKAIDDLLATLQNPKAPDDPKATDKDRAAVALRRLYATFEKLEEAKAEAKTTLESPLATQKALDELQKETINRALALDEAKLVLKRQKVVVLQEQAKAYGIAQALLNVGVTYADLPLGQDAPVPVAGERQKPAISADEKARLARAAAHYGYAIGHLEALLSRLRLKETALQKQNTLLLSENSVKQWELLIGANVDLLVDWGNGGLTQQDVSSLINAVLLLWIGLGVH